MKALNKLLSFLLVLVLLVSLCAPAAAAESSSIYIRSAEDLINLSKNCTLDSWSVGKTVLLMKDVDLTGVEFTSIPTFGGAFNGLGHTISGLSLAESGDVRGLFRYVQSGAAIYNLTVKGEILPTNHKRTVGGIAGSNAGTLRNCTFIGTIKGKSIVGGIAGINEEAGQIINCSFSGSVTGEHYIGGIVGQNLGSVIQCVNNGDINTTEVKSTTSITDLDLEQITSTENTLVCTDLGGIAGFSSGVIQSCKNLGSVGYPHTGYNVGGIVGRQTGYLDGCTNEGTVQGRKDVGGIAGQMEPQLTLKYDQTALNRLWAELDTLEGMIAGLLDDVSVSSHTLSGQVQALSDAAAAVKSAVEDTSQALTDWADGSIDQINVASARISWVLDRIDPIVDVMESSIGQLETAADLFSEGLAQSSTAAEIGADAAAEMSLAMGDLQDSADIAQQALKHLRSSISLLKTGLGDSATTQQALNNMSSAIGSLAAAFSAIADSFSRIYTAMDTVYVWVKEDPNWIALRQGTMEIVSAMAEITVALEEIGTAVENISTDPELDGSVKLLGSGISHLLDGISHLSSAFEDFSSALYAYQGGDTESALSSLASGQADLTQAGSDIQTAVSNLESALALLEQDDDLEGYLDELKRGVSHLNDGLADANSAINKISTALDNLSTSSIPDAAMENVRRELAIIDRSVQVADAALQQFAAALQTLENNLDVAALETSLTQLELAFADLASAAGSLSQALGHLETAMDHVEDAADELAGGLNSFSAGAAAMGDSFSLLKQAVEETDTIIETLAAMPAIQFDSLGDSISAPANSLSSSADLLITRANALNGMAAKEADGLLADLEVINTQIGVIVDLLEQLVKEQLENDSEDHLEDVSGQDTGDTRSSGKISGCANLGSVDGDSNTGGIVGSIAIEYDFDPEDDLTISGERTLSVRYLARAVVRACTNRGPVTAKKDCAGGIVGTMSMGRIIACQGYGTVSSTNGDYVGGIAGESYGGITDSWAMCVLSGGDYVGGIAGLATDVTNCRTLILLENGGDYVGAIAGLTEDGGTLTGNLFVHHELAGVDGISYGGSAEPVSYETLRALDDIPEDFTHFELTFLADGQVVEIVSFTYGDSLDALPTVPEKAGYTAGWPELDYGFLTFSREVEAEYIPYATALSDGGTPPGILVDGHFSTEAALSWESSAVIWTDSAGSTHRGTRYVVTVTDPLVEDRTCTIHFRIPDSEKSYTLWLWNGETWVEQTDEADGSYFVLTCTGGEVTFCLTEDQIPLDTILLVCAAAVALLILFAIIRGSRKRKAKKKEALAAVSVSEEE